MIQSRKTTLFPLSSFVGEAKVPFKIRALVWTLVLNKININDVLQSHRACIRISPYWCLMCKASSEYHDHVSPSLWMCLSTLGEPFLGVWGSLGESWFYLSLP